MTRGRASRLASLLRSPRRLVATVRRRLSDRGDTEHEQALIRTAIVAMLLIYAGVMPLEQPDVGWWVPSVAQVGYLIFALSLLHFTWIVLDPVVQQVRRTAWMAIDHASIVLAMAVGGEPMALLYPLLLWVTLGHGFRYGPRHLVGSSLISVVLFGPLVFLHPFWQTKGVFGVGLILALVLIPGYCLRLLSHLNDARRRAEASSDAKSRFLATMSHELRTPLHAILGMAELLRGTALDAEQRDMTRTIHTSGHGLLNMIDDILDIARIEAGAVREEIEPFDVHRLLHHIRDMLGYRARTKGLALHLRLDPDLPPTIEGPRRALEHILINLVTNAIKFTDDGSVLVEARLESTGAAAGDLLLTVTDTGCGIPVSAQARIFESFAQADETTTRRHGGSGLGLAIVKRLVDDADGRIALTSAVAEGSRFEIAIPVAVIAEVAPPGDGLVVVHGTPTPVQLGVLEASGLAWRPAIEVESGFVSAAAVDLCCPLPPGMRPEPRHGRDLVAWADGRLTEEALVVLSEDATVDQLCRAVRAALVIVADAGECADAERVHIGDTSLDILVADDHRINHQVIERLLARGGHRAVVVESGEAALEMIEQASFDVVVLDLNMPGMGGLAAARQLVGREPRPRLVALTADATTTTRLTCMRAGFDSFLTKPVDGTRLLEAVHASTSLPAPVTRAEEAAPSATEPAPDAAPDGVLDERRLAMLRQLDEGDGFVVEIIDGFIADGRDLIEDIKQAAAAGDVARFRDAAHALRSAATHLGATALFERCLAIKALSEDALEARAVTLGSELDEAFRAVSAALVRARDEMAEVPAVACPARVSSLGA